MNLGTMNPAEWTVCIGILVTGLWLIATAFLEDAEDDRLP